MAGLHHAIVADNCKTGKSNGHDILVMPYLVQVIVLHPPITGEAHVHLNPARKAPPAHTWQGPKNGGKPAFVNTGVAQALVVSKKLTSFSTPKKELRSF